MREREQADLAEHRVRLATVHAAVGQCFAARRLPAVWPRLPMRPGSKSEAASSLGGGESYGGYYSDSVWHGASSSLGALLLESVCAALRAHDEANVGCVRLLRSYGNLVTLATAANFLSLLGRECGTEDSAAFAAFDASPLDVRRDRSQTKVRKPAPVHARQAPRPTLAPRQATGAAAATTSSPRPAPSQPRPVAPSAPAPSPTRLWADRTLSHLPSEPRPGLVGRAAAKPVARKPAGAQRVAAATKPAAPAVAQPVGGDGGELLERRRFRQSVERARRQARWLAAKINAAPRGGQEALARLLGCRSGSLSMWLRKRGARHSGRGASPVSISRDRILEIDKAVHDLATVRAGPTLERRDLNPFRPPLGPLRTPAWTPLTRLSCAVAAVGRMARPDAGSNAGTCAFGRQQPPCSTAVAPVGSEVRADGPPRVLQVPPALCQPCRLHHAREVLQRRRRGRHEGGGGWRGAAFRRVGCL